MSKPASKSNTKTPRATATAKSAPKSATKRTTDYRHRSLMSFNDIRLTESQHDLYKKIMDNDIVIVTGPAGASKTFTTCYAGLKLLDKGLVDQIYLTKPIEEAGERIGFLPGTIEEKTDPYMESFITNMDQIIDPMEVQALIEGKIMKVKPLAYMRGASYRNTFMVLDEAQNCDFRQLMLYITRKGKGTKMLIMGDVTQYDIDKLKIALPKFAKMLDGIPSIVTHTFTKQDIVRDPILIEIAERYEKYKEEGLTTGNKRS